MVERSVEVEVTNDVIATTKQSALLMWMMLDLLMVLAREIIYLRIYIYQIRLCNQLKSTLPMPFPQPSNNQLVG